MPLETGKSKEAFQHNVKAEIDAGKSQKQAVAIAYHEAGEDSAIENAESARETDRNGYMTVYDNPIICAGVFQYKGAQLPGGDPNKIYNVYRPLEELTSPETLESFKGLPIINEHEMLGDRYARSPEERGAHGSILESLRVKGRDIVANLRIWSRTLRALIDAGKKGLSLGYNCKWEKSAGVFEGIAYDYIQRNIRGNHLALVTQGRNGTAVLDQHDVLDHFDLALDKMELDMADDDKKDDKATKSDANKETPKGDSPAKDEKKEISLDDVHGWAKSNMDKFRELIGMMKMAEEDEGGDEVLDEDTKKKDGDQALDEDKKDEKEGKAMDKTYDKAMDAADVERIVTKKLKDERKNIRADIVARDTLAKDLTAQIGTFDFAAMDSDDVAVYGLDKLGLKAEKGTEKAVLAGYLAGVKKSASTTGYAMDSAIKLNAPKADGKLAKRLNSAA